MSINNDSSPQGTFWIWLIRRIAVLSTVMVGVPASLVVLSQDIQIYPGVLYSYLSSSTPQSVPEHVTSARVESEPGIHLEMWRMAPSVPADPIEFRRTPVMLILHGNGDSIYSLVKVQEMFARIGFITYTFDYRGFGRSTGWPSEKGLYIDSSRILEEVAIRENVSREHIFLTGISLGSGPASYLAERYHTKSLLLISPFTSISDVANYHPFLRYLSPLLWSEFPVKKYVRGLSDSCITIGAGERDTVVPAALSISLKDEIPRRNTVHLFTASDAGHVDILWKQWDKIRESILACARRQLTPTSLP